MLKFFVYHDKAQLRVYVLHPDLTYDAYSLGYFLKGKTYVKSTQIGNAKGQPIEIHFANSHTYEVLDELIVAIKDTKYPHKNQLIQLLLRDLI